MVFRVLIWLMTGIRPRQWVAVHRKHHAFTDVPGDPHSPVLLGFWRVQLANAALYRKVARDGVTTQRYAKDLPPDRWDKLLFDHAFLGLGIGIGALCLVLGWRARPRRRRRARGELPGPQRGHQCRRAQLRDEELSQHRLQQPMARLHHRRRGPAQQPSRRARPRRNSPSAATSSTRAGG